MLNIHARNLNLNIQAPGSLTFIQKTDQCKFHNLFSFSFYIAWGMGSGSNCHLEVWIVAKNTPDSFRGDGNPLFSSFPISIFSSGSNEYVRICFLLVKINFNILKREQRVCGADRDVHRWAGRGRDQLPQEVSSLSWSSSSSYKFFLSHHSSLWSSSSPLISGRWRRPGCSQSRIRCFQKPFLCQEPTMRKYLYQSL